MTDATATTLTLSILNAPTGTILPPTIPVAAASAKPFLSLGPACEATTIPVDMNNIYNQFLTQAAYQYRI